MVSSYVSSPSHSLDTSDPVGVFLTSGQLGAENSTSTHNNQKRQNFVPPVVFEVSIPSKRAVAAPRLKPQGYWVRWMFSIALSSVL